MIRWKLRNNQLLWKLFQALLPKAKPNAQACFLAGPNLSKPNKLYSAYAASKAGLAQAVKTLDAELPIKCFMLAPGVVQTPIHEQGAKGGDARSVEILRGGEETTSHQDIYDCLQWCLRSEVGGTTVHIVNDPWRGGHLRAA